jgi:hypothetical protein
MYCMCIHQQPFTFEASFPASIHSNRKRELTHLIGRPQFSSAYHAPFETKIGPSHKAVQGALSLVVMSEKRDAERAFFSFGRLAAFLFTFLAGCS